MAVMMLVIPVLADTPRPAVPQRRAPAGRAADGPAALARGFAHRSYSCLFSGFFVCGFQVAFITAHFPAYRGDLGIDARYAVYRAGADRLLQHHRLARRGRHRPAYSKPKFLALDYIGRSIAVTAFLLLPQTPTSVIIFAIVMGLLWLSTVPPTNGARGDHVRHAPSRDARRRRLPVAPDRLVPRRLARRLSLRPFRHLRPGLVARRGARHLRRDRALADPERPVERMRLLPAE